MLVVVRYPVSWEFNGLSFQCRHIKNDFLDRTYTCLVTTLRIKTYKLNINAHLLIFLLFFRMSWPSSNLAMALYLESSIVCDLTAELLETV